MIQMAYKSEEQPSTASPHSHNKELRGERYRPQFHYTPARNWMNDPNGLVCSPDGYHLFYQYNPNASTWGDIAWGHAVSSDLVHWRELPVAIDPPDQFAFSGSAVSVGDAIVAAYTGHDPISRNEHQRLVRSEDGGRSWTACADDTAISRVQPHFRDPRLLWHEESACWVMAVSLAIEHRIVFYRSRDLTNWQEQGSFYYVEEEGVEWECPELLRFDDPNDPSEKVWMLKLDVSRGAANGGSGGKYFLGDFDGRVFNAKPLISGSDGQVNDWAWIDSGKDFYAAQAFTGVPSKHPPTWIAWVSNWQYARDIPTKPWRGCQSLPRELRLVSCGRGYQLRQRPIEALKALRGESLLQDATKVVSSDSQYRFEAGQSFQLVIRFTDWTAHEFGIDIAVGSQCRTRIAVRPQDRSIAVDRRRSGVTEFSLDFPGKHLTGLKCLNAIDIQLFFDGCVLELFVDDGAAVFTELVFPDPDAGAVEFFARGGSVQVSDASCWQMRSTWSSHESAAALSNPGADRYA